MVPFYTDLSNCASKATPPIVNRFHFTENLQKMKLAPMITKLIDYELKMIPVNIHKTQISNLRTDNHLQSSVRQMGST